MKTTLLSSPFYLFFLVASKLKSAKATTAHHELIKTREAMIEV